MADPLNRLASGSIVGFTQIKIGESTETIADPIHPSKFSLAEFLERLKKILRALDPSVLFDLMDKINKHINSSGNVHNLTLSDFGNDVFAAFSKVLLPGILPQSLPTASVVSPVVEFLPYDVTLTHTDNLWVTDITGKLVEITANEMAYDYGVNGYPLIPIFPSRTNYFIRSNAVTAHNYVTADNTARLIVNGNSTLTNSDGTILAPDQTNNCVICSETPDTVNTYYGVTLAYIGAVDTDRCVTSAFILPINAKYIKMFLLDLSGTITLTNYYATINTETCTVVEQGSGIEHVYIFKSPNGYLRLGIQYLLEDSNTSISMVIRGFPTENTINYSGTGIDLFAIACIQNTYGPGLCPYIPTAGSSVTCSGSILSIDIDDKLPVTQGTVSFTCYVLPNGSGGNATTKGTDLLQIDNIPIYELTDTGYTFSLDTVSISHTLSSMKEYTFAFSFASDITYQFSNDQTIDVYTVGTTITGDHVFTFGNVPGYFDSLTVYPITETVDVLEFLVGTPTA